MTQLCGMTAGSGLRLLGDVHSCKLDNCVTDAYKQMLLAFIKSYPPFSQALTFFKQDGFLDQW
eukprot:269292-Pelagomonas_calceolata.AAC.7